GSSINARDILKHLREIMSANLLASGAIATLVSIDRNGKYGLLTETALLLEHLEKNHRHEIGVKVYDPHTLAQHDTPNPNPHVADLTGTPSVAEAAVLATGARLIIPKHIANHSHGSSTIAIGRITP
ncbi:cobalamin biosynthesis protein, partial [Dermatophilus congolensis]